jgi:cytochrome c oxidase assembly factor CtaG
MLADHAPGWGAWSADPLLIGWLFVVAVIYLRCYRRAQSRSARASATHWIAFVAGLAAVVVALLSPLDPIGERWLLSAHVAQHLLLADIAPALIVLGWRAPVLPLGLPGRVLRVIAPGGRLGRPLRLMRNGWLAAALWATVQWGWSVPAVFDAAAANPALHAFEHLTLFGSGLLLWWAVVDPLPGERRHPTWARLAYLGLSRVAAAVVCLPLTWLGTALYPRYVDAPRSYGISALRDQQIAGASMCLVELLVFGIAFMVVFLDLLSREDRATAVAERAAADERSARWEEVAS